MMERRKIAISKRESNVATRLHRVICFLMEVVSLVVQVEGGERNEPVHCIDVRGIVLWLGRRRCLDPLLMLAPMQQPWLVDCYRGFVQSCCL